MENKYDFSICKICKKKAGIFTYKLKKSNVYVCQSCHFHYSSFLDNEYAHSDEDVNTSTPTNEQLSQYIRTQLQNNQERFENHVKIVEANTTTHQKTILDIGCGGGLFLSLMQKRGYNCYGIELDNDRKNFSKNEYNLENIFSIPLQDKFWQENYAEKFDIITLWDVIEHVNFPTDIIFYAQKLLNKNGVILLDTPCRNTFYHRVGDLTYKLSGGNFPTFLNIMYSDHPYGHKQILSFDDMNLIAKETNTKIKTIEVFHELSFPYSYYLSKIFKSKALVVFIAPVVTLFFKIFRIKNKMLVVFNFA